MKFLAKVVIAGSLLLFPMGGSFHEAYGANAPKVVVNGQVVYMEQPIYYDGGVIFAPARSLMDKLGFSLSWDEEQQAAIGTKRDQVISLKPGNPIALVNRLVVELAAVPRLVDGSLYVPIESVARSLGQEVLWNEITQTIFIKADLASKILDTLEVDKEQLTYEGQSSFGKKQGLGSLNKEGQLVYSGDFNQDKLEGTGRFYENGRLIYEGGFVSNLPQGFGTYYGSDGSEYTGAFEKGKRQGKGNLYVSGVLVYQGEWKNGRMEGIGRVYNAKNELVYDGGFNNNERSGFGISYSQGKKAYAGDWKHGLREGTGRSYDRDEKLAYEGSWSEDRRNGEGTSYRFGKTTIYQLDSNNRVSGKEEVDAVTMRKSAYRDDKLYSEGTSVIYTGDIDKQGIPHGTGKLSTMDRETIYEGSGTIFSMDTIYEGVFVNGKMTGTGKLYVANHKLVYEGQVVDGIRSGLGRSFRDGAITFEGYWSNDQENGTGRAYEYTTGFPSDTYIGKGTIYLYEGTYSNGKLTESGNIYRYVGDFRKGKPDGLGKLTLMYDRSSGETRPSLSLMQNLNGTSLHDGVYSDGYREGIGTQYEKGSVVYKGQFARNERSGTGTLYWDGMEYTGNFLHDRREGSFKVYNSYHTLVFEGTYENDRKKGTGKAYDDSGRLVYQGEFLNNQRNGYGTLYDYAGNILYQGEFKDDKTMPDYIKSTSSS